MEETVWQRFNVDDSIVPDEMKSRKLGRNDRVEVLVDDVKCLYSHSCRPSTSACGCCSNSVIENLSGETFRVLPMDPRAEDVGCRHTVVMAASLLGERGELEVEIILMLGS